MKYYIRNTLILLNRYSKNLADKSILITQPWIIFSNSNDIKTSYIFRKNGELVVSINGDVQRAKWEIIGNNQLLIEKNKESVLFNKGFIDKEILILQKDNTQDYLFLGNLSLYQKGVSNTDQVISYMSAKYNVAQSKTKKKSQKDRLKAATYIAKLNDDNIIRIEKKKELKAIEGRMVFTEDLDILDDGEYYLQNDQKIKVEAGMIESIIYLEKYKVKGVGELVIHQRMKGYFQEGDSVTINNKIINNGSYRISIFEKISVKNGKIIKIGII